MSDFPSSLPEPSKGFLRQKFIKAQVLTPYENGVQQSRGKHTSGRWFFTIGWRTLSTTEYGVLKTHFEDNVGGTFNWTHPITSTVYVVRYLGDELPEATPTGIKDGEQAWQIGGIQLGEK